METNNSPNERISEEALYAFYTFAVLPQFGCKDENDIVWTDSRRIEADEFAHFLTIDTVRHVLVWEDYEGIGKNEDFIRDHVTDGAAFEFVEPTSQTNIAPSYDGFRLPAPSQYCENITGTFTLIKFT